MGTIPQVTNAMQTVLSTSADQAAQITGFVQRTSKLTGAAFVQTVVFGFLANPRATRTELAATAATLGVDSTAQGLDARLSERAAACLRSVLDATATTVLAADPLVVPLLERLGGLLVQDSSTVGLPPLAGWA